MAEYLPDSARVEMLIIPMTLYHLLDSARREIDWESCGASEEHLAEIDKIRKGAWSAVQAATDGVEHKRAVKLMRRALRVSEETGVLPDGQMIAKTCMILYYLLEELLQEDRLWITEGDPFAEAMQIMIDALAGYFGQERLDASAQKQSRRARERLAAAGYYR